tara:strand:+ start:2802 stop:2903 length:102 start_codon:yes stop_codon:yes gene_type:complete
MEEIYIVTHLLAWGAGIATGAYAVTQLDEKLKK